MPRLRNDWLAKHLQTLLQASTGLDALAIVSLDGIEIASALPQGVNAGRLSAMALAAFTLSEQIATELKRHKLEEVYIRGKQGFIVVIPLDKQAILVAMARENARLGLVLLELHRTAKNLLKIKKEGQAQSSASKFQ
jgi:predicted regulator of Ras-like GTPase activity (Roadblock/LC7/MglB family)